MSHDTPTPETGPQPRRRYELSPVDKQIFALAIPAFGALIAEPLFVLADTAIVGHLGSDQLAGLSIGSTLLMTVVGLCVFLAYATTAQVARRIGAGQRAAGLRMGIDGIWLGCGLGVVLTIALLVAAPWAVGALGASGEVQTAAVTYVRWSAPGLPGMLVVLAATGVLRGLQDTKTPLVVASVGAIANAFANLLLVYGLGLGIAGSGLGTAVIQLAMGATLAWVIAKATRAEQVSLLPHRGGLLAGLTAGAPLLVRTLSLRVAILLTVAVATRLGPTTLAGHQIINALWGLAAFALDAIAIAAQALIATTLGAGDRAATRAILARCLRWGVACGAVIGIVMAGAGWLITTAFTPDPEVRHAAAAALMVAGIMMPMAGWVFMLDGVLIGAGDGRYLAWAGMLTLAVYAPAAVAVGALATPGTPGLVWLWLAFSGVFMGARAVTTGWRIRGNAWERIGAS